MEAVEAAGVAGTLDAARGGGAGGPSRAEMRWVADAYAQAQRRRVQIGEQLRAILQGRDSGWGVTPPPAAEVPRLLASIRDGRCVGPVPLLGAEYRRFAAAEAEWRAAMARLAVTHPAWPWLDRVKGVGATLAVSLLSRLDVRRARNPSAFWAYCGLATVAGVRFRCATCGLTLDFGDGQRVSGRHRARGTAGICAGTLGPAPSGDDALRVAQRRPSRGQSATFDKRARELCYLLGVSFLRTRGKYASFYDAQRARLEETRPAWVAGRKHLTALRITEKLFLSHLWVVWREAEGLPVTVPYAQVDGEGRCISPWSMVEAGADVLNQPDQPERSTTSPWPR